MSRKPIFILTAAVTAVAASLAFAATSGPAPASRGASTGRGAPAPAASAPVEAPVILPKSIPADGKPQINGPRVTSGTPGHVFLFKIPATGDAPLAFSADNLPAGLTLDSSTGIITGSLKAPLAVATTFHVKNSKGEAVKQIVIVGGDHKLALTPPLGWNSWNCWGLTVTDARVRAAADGFIASGLAAHGFQYVNIDDGWEIPAPNPNRGRGRGAATTSGPASASAPATTTAPAGPALRAPDGTILCNTKFPDMKALGEYIHGKGLKFGIYSSPGPRTCGGYTASWQHEEQDAATWTSWGVDYIKYDWCSYSEVVQRDPTAPPINSGYSMAILKQPYQVLRKALDKQNRDIVMSLCQYGWGAVWEWGAEDGINGNVWRATGDITDTWQSMSNIAFQQNGHEAFTGPNHWNDTDMLVVGKVGWSNNLHDSRLTQNEQVTHIGLWAILAAPMLMGCDLTQLNDFTINLMSNDEVLAVNQDPLGMQGKRISPTGSGQQANRAPAQVWARQLWDGTIAVGLFNLGDAPAPVVATLTELNAGLKTTIPAGAPVRDLWQLKNLAPAAESISLEVPRHGMILLKIGTPKPEAESIANIVKLHAPK